MSAGRKRHRVSVYRPQGSLNERGQDQSETVIYHELPAEVRTLSSREQEVARQNYAMASHEVKVYADPKRPIQQTDWLILGGKRFEVGGVNDIELNGVELVLICGEVRDG